MNLIEVPFSLTCLHCDAGDDCHSEQQATLKVWTEIEEDLGGLSWNYLGVCPDCQEQHNGP